MNEYSAEKLTDHIYWIGILMIVVWIFILPFELYTLVEYEVLDFNLQISISDLIGFSGLTLMSFSLSDYKIGLKEIVYDKTNNGNKLIRTILYSLILMSFFGIYYFIIKYYI